MNLKKVIVPVVVVVLGIIGIGIYLFLKRSETEKRFIEHVKLIEKGIVI